MIIMYHQIILTSYKLIENWPNWPDKLVKFMDQRVVVKLTYQMF